MARTKDQILTQLKTIYVAALAAVGITVDPLQWSKRNKQLLALNTFADGTAIFEQVLDSYNTDTEATIAAGSPQTGPWLQDQMLKFQFDATTPQILQFDTENFAPYYETVDEDLRVIKYCSVVGTSLGRTLIKVAAQVGGFPADLDTTYPGALAAAQSTALLLTVEGITYVVQSGNSDKIYIAATIYYQGLYSAVISDTVIEAINTYLASIPFNGVVILSDIERAVKSVPGVNDIVLTNVQARADGTAYGSGTDLVIGVDGATPTGNVIQRKWATVSGYIVAETTATHELTDSLTFIPE